MNPQDVNRLALIFAVQAEIEGMKAKNIMSSIRGEYPAYDENDFNEKAKQLYNLALR